jgi:hypothetical protein
LKKGNLLLICCYIEPKLKEEWSLLKKRLKQTFSKIGWMTRIHPIMVTEKRMMLGLYSDVFNCSLAAFTEDWGRTLVFQ